MYKQTYEAAIKHFRICASMKKVGFNQTYFAYYVTYHISKVLKYTNPKAHWVKKATKLEKNVHKTSQKLQIAKNCFTNCPTNRQNSPQRCILPVSFPVDLLTWQ